MKTNHLPLTLAAALFLAPLSSSHAQTWQTVYEGSHVTPPATWIADFAADTASGVAALETVYDPVAGTSSSALLLSPDSGLTWVRHPQPTSSFADVAIADSGDLFASSSTGTIFRSVDAGLTWTATWVNPAGNSTDPTAAGVHDLAPGSGGVIYAATEIKPRWLLLKGTPTAANVSWTVVDDYAPDSKTVYEPNCIAVCRGGGISGADEIYVGGFQNHSRNGGSFLVRKSRDGWATWTTAMTFQIVPGAYMGAGISHIAANGAGTVYVAGRMPVSVVKTGRTTTYVNASVVRKSTDGGANWVTVLQSDSVVRGLAVTPGGRVFLGSRDQTTGASTVQESSDGGLTWSISDPLMDPRAQYPNVSVDAAGNIFSSGSIYQGGVDATFSSYSFIRRLAATAP